MVPTYCSLLKGVFLQKCEVYVRLHPACSYRELRDHLHNSLDRNQDKSSEMAFNERCRLPGETLQEYGTKLDVLAWAAFGSTEGCSSPMIDKLCVITFLRNLKGPLGEKVREQFVNSMDEATVVARNFELAGITESAKISAVTRSRGGGAAPYRLPQQDKMAIGQEI